jgi:hypothetical protein
MPAASISCQHHCARLTDHFHRFGVETRRSHVRGPGARLYPLVFLKSPVQNAARSQAARDVVKPNRALLATHRALKSLTVTRGPNASSQPTRGRSTPREGSFMFAMAFNLLSNLAIASAEDRYPLTRRAARRGQAGARRHVARGAWTRGKIGRDFYIRQLRDMKISPLVELCDVDLLQTHCAAERLGGSRGRTPIGRPCDVRRLLGSNGAFDDGICAFAVD